jgi:hypothetical protein
MIAEAIVRLTREQNPPLRLLLGSDAYNGAEKNDGFAHDTLRSNRNGLYLAPFRESRRRFRLKTASEKRPR